MSATILLNPLSTLRVSRHLIPRYQDILNTSLHSSRPLLVYHSAFPSSATAAEIESHLHSVNVVTPQWRYTMYSTTHFHSTSHEVLVIAQGKARCCFGGERNPGRVEVSLSKGDVVVLPAGVGHRLLHDEEEEGSFLMVGSYPVGCSWDMCYGDGREGEDGEEIAKRIRGLAWFERDPIYGNEGPVVEEKGG